jgi:hypothetical protein
MPRLDFSVTHGAFDNPSKPNRMNCPYVSPSKSPTMRPEWCLVWEFPDPRDTEVLQVAAYSQNLY